ncbi:hypothetical protein CCHL11_01520 [Colletotrichum chlorophyti]|uniref:Integral membrane protein n=1 Tax=Colletotrichum chlorophyti TaxID=708187 RepID=A0A1Q8RYI2_9PEZI|nr:hypothetical protein CCHL11_01520 [Colletotrichum chlorophyti]
MLPRGQVQLRQNGLLELHAIPPILRPLLRAYLLGYASAVAPRILTLLMQYVTKKRRKTAKDREQCAGFLLQSKKSSGFTETVPVKSDTPPGAELKEIRYAGRTLDLTLFTITRALDVAVGEFWSRRRARRAESLISRFTDPCLFVASCALIMWAWFYNPARLPIAYNKWISSAARVDMRLIEALQRLRAGKIVYGKDTGEAGLLQGMCEKYKWPAEWGDPAKSVPIPCEMVHMGCGPSCEIHAISRFYRSWKWSMAMYIPLSMALLIRGPVSKKNVLRALLSASRSSAFLGTYITLFYYGVCLARTRLGPRIIGTDAAARQKIDAGFCVGTGCCLCGWSVLVETASRRKDMALFVAPRAMATLLPRRYGIDKQWRETVVFAASAAVVFTCVMEKQARVRGVLGGVLGMVMRK